MTARVVSPPALQPSGPPAPYVPRGGARPGSAGGRLGLDARLASVSARSVSGSGTSPGIVGGQQPGVMDSHSAALLDNIRSLDHLPRLGSLTTLDLRGNDLRVSVPFLLLFVGHDLDCVLMSPRMSDLLTYSYPIRSRRMESSTLLRSSSEIGH